MRLSEQEFLYLMSKKKVQRIILPFRLPTWNQLLAMNHWQRKKVRDWIKSAVSMSIIEHNASRTVTGVVVKLLLTDWSLQEYYKMIVPSSSAKYLNRKRNQNQMKQL